MSLSWILGSECPIQPANITFTSSNLTSITFQIKWSTQLFKKKIDSLMISYIPLEVCNSHQNSSSSNLCQNGARFNVREKNLQADDNIYTLGNLIPDAMYQIDVVYNVSFCENQLQNNTAILMTSKSSNILFLYNYLLAYERATILLSS